MGKIQEKPLFKQDVRMGSCKNSSSIDVSFSKGAKSEKLTSIILQNKGKFVILRKVILNTNDRKRYDAYHPKK
jgi:hypothetical protein